MKKSYTTVEEAYIDMFGSLTRRAESLLNNPDCAFDCVQDLFVKLSEYSNKFPNRKLRSFLINKKLHTTARKYNRKMFAEQQAKVLLSRTPTRKLSDSDALWNDKE